ncbi:hypothetical protein C0J52_23823 [Blattella germanica]|nr:hypothetical protein C0J52_23823 [Blattella germanica]
MSDSDYIQKVAYEPNNDEEVENCAPLVNGIHSENHTESKMNTSCTSVHTVYKSEDEVSEASKTLDDRTETNDTDSSISISSSANDLCLNAEEIDLPDGVEQNLETETYPTLSVEDELLLEINMHEESSTKIPPPNGISSSIINHPAYRTVIEDLAGYKEQVSKMQLEINRLESERQRLEADRSPEIYQVQLETLEKTIANQQRELQTAKEQSNAQLEQANKLKLELEAKLEKVTKQYEAANRDKEAMVMRYAVSEKEVIDQKKERESLEKRLRELGKERDIMLGKLKGMSAEKTRICQLLDNKKENEKLKEDLNSREIKIKWAQNKLKTEMDAHKELQAKFDKQNLKLQEMREESEQVRRDCQAMIQAYQESQENKAQSLDEQLKEQQAKLILERHEREDKEETQKHLLQEVENLKKKHQLFIDENNLLSIKVQNLEKERLEYEQNLSKQKRTIDQQRQDIVDLQAQVAEMESLKIHGQEKLLASQGEVERLRNSNAELQLDMSSCREREAELLNFTQKLTDKNVRLQSEFSATEAKAQQLECEQGPLQRQISELESVVAALTTQLEEEKTQRRQETELLARHLAERTQRADTLLLQLEDSRGENQVLRRKQASALKELTRELQHCRKRLELYESSSGSNSLGQGSRASSCNSLNTIDGSTINNSSKSTDHGSPGNSSSSQLQKSNARKTEKLDFMEEHSRQLVAELQKKTRIVQNYILREQAGALSSDSMDQNKAELSRHGGIMASVYGSRAVDNSMTLELSLEINRKLQAVLEDTLLKNITLKENIDTLGAEIARLTSDKQNGRQT